MDLTSRRAGAQPFEPALPVLRMNRPVGRFTSSAPTRAVEMATWIAGGLQTAGTKMSPAAWWVSIFIEGGVRGANVAKKKDAAKVLSSEAVLHTRVFDVQRERVIDPSGVAATRDIIVHPGSVVVLPVLADGGIVLIRQYRHSVERYLWELVAGRGDGEESFVAGARRELREETGYRARRMRLLLDLFPSPGFLR